MTKASAPYRRVLASKDARALLDGFGLNSSDGSLISTSPIDGTVLGCLPPTGLDHLDAVIGGAQSAFLEWRAVPAPHRGQLVRLLGEELRKRKAPLAKLITLECGK